MSSKNGSVDYPLDGLDCIACASMCGTVLLQDVR